MLRLPCRVQQPPALLPHGVQLGLERVHGALELVGGGDGGRDKGLPVGVEGRPVKGDLELHDDAGRVFLDQEEKGGGAVHGGAFGVQSAARLTRNGLVIPASFRVRSISLCRALVTSSRDTMKRCGTRVPLRTWTALCASTLTSVPRSNKGNKARRAFATTRNTPAPCCGSSLKRGRLQHPKVVERHRVMVRA